ncbi:hypothetical protein ECDEC2E_4424 [Escherichia coli DEC2E]|nr:hypothetical protein ECDEC2E_4424 [Escherichia coli DEC2E]
MEMQLLKSFVNEMVFFYIIDFKWILKIYDFFCGHLMIMYFTH